jgi:uncharacterized protein YndB with AHSA1/START domain
MNESRFVYVTYIRTTPEKLWRAITDPEFQRKYWLEAWQESEWKVGAPWRIVYPDGRVTDSGEVLEIEPNRKIVLKWRNEFRPELKAEGFARMTYEIEQMEGEVKLTILHEIDTPESKLIKAVSGGWPLILSGLKSLLETGDSLEITKHRKKI